MSVPVDYLKFIERRQEICGGEAVIKGTRVTVRTIFASLAEGASVDEIVADFPTVSREAVRAMIAYAAGIRRRRAVHAPAMPMPKSAVNEDGRFVFRQNNVGRAGKFPDMQPKTIAHPMKQ